MRRNVVAVAMAIAGVSSVFAACKSNEVNQSSKTTNNFMSVGPKGDTVPGPDGTMIKVPAGALDTTINMGIVEAEDDEYPALGSVQPLGKVYSFLPHGQSFLVDATITMPAPNGDVDVYRAQPDGKWELFAKPKAVGGLVNFRTSGLSFYAVATGTGGCVRNLDCGAGQACIETKCVTAPSDAGVDSGSDTAVTETGADTGFCAVPADSGKTSTVGSTAMGTWLSGTATTKSGADGSDFVQDVRIKIADFVDSCAYATDGKLKANAKMIFVDLFRKSTTATPAAWTTGTYTITPPGSGDEQILVQATSIDAECRPGDGAGASGTVTITAIDATHVAGSWNIPSLHSGTFDVPICNTMSGATGCCVK